MMDRCGLLAGETVLVRWDEWYRMPIKIAKAFGATVFATARTPENARDA